MISALRHTFASHSFSTSFILTTAATLLWSTPSSAETALTPSHFTMTLFQINSRASSDSTGWLMNAGLEGNGRDGPLELLFER